MHGTIKSTFFHPEHLLIERNSYGGSSYFVCDACGLMGTGPKYSCHECEFDIHEACFTGLPGCISVGNLGGQQDLSFTLTRLDASRSCVSCKDTSPAGRYMYYGALPGSGDDDDVHLHPHPRCVLLLTVTQDLHPQHFLSFYFYDDALASYPCAACERVCTGLHFRCGECDFNVHSGCLSLPRSISFAKHSSQHELTLTRLTASRWCDVCKETSHDGWYMYLCIPCNYDVHPRCVASLAPLADGDGGGAAQAHPSRGGRRAVMKGLHTVRKVADTVDSVYTVVDTVNTLASVGMRTIM